jgi:protein-tyrosine phosphatase
MYRILFICHGNICRSPMAEFVMKHLAYKAGCAPDFVIESAATSTEELGNDMHPGTRAKLDEMGIPYKRRGARRIIPEDYDEYDLLIGMDDENIKNMCRCFGPDRGLKVHKLLEYCGLTRGVADPWFTGDFDKTYADISAGCRSLFAYLKAGG